LCLIFSLFLRVSLLPFSPSFPLTSLLSLSVFLSLSLSVSVSDSLCVTVFHSVFHSSVLCVFESLCLFSSLSIYQTLHLPLRLSVSISHISVTGPLHLSVYSPLPYVLCLCFSIYAHISVRPSLSIFPHSISPSLFLSPYQFVCIKISLSPSLCVCVCVCVCVFLCLCVSTFPR
jgi:hypothetical protein